MIATKQISIAYTIIPAKITLAATPANVLMSAPASVHLTLVTFAVIQYTENK